MKTSSGHVHQIVLRILLFAGALLLLTHATVFGQNWFMPGYNQYPSGIHGFAGTKRIYGYNEQGDLYSWLYDTPVYESQWSMSLRGSLTGLNFIESGMDYAVGDGGAMWRTDSKASEFYIPIPTSTDADLYHLCRFDYDTRLRCFAVGERGTIIQFFPKSDSSTIVTENVHPTLRSVVWVGGSSLIAVGDSGCILVSSDRGGTWQRRDHNSTLFYRQVAVYNNAVVILTGHDRATGEAVVIRTDVKLADWLENRFHEHSGVSGIRFSKNVWFAYGDDGLLASTNDEARSWQICRHGTRFQFSDIWINHASITAVGRSQIDGHFRSIISSDTGKTWSIWLEPEDSLGAICIPRTAGANTPLVTEKGYVLKFESSNIYPSRVSLSVPYALYSCATVDNSVWVIGGADGRILLGNRDGTAWRATAALSDDVIGLDAWRRGGRVIALTRDSRIYRSSDSGAVWHLAHAAPAGCTVTRIQCESGDTCLAIGRGDDKAAAWMSIDGGYEWNKVFEYDAEITGIDVDSTGAVYICTADGKLFRTTDSGKSCSVLLLRQGARFTDVSAGSRTHITLIQDHDRILASTDAGYSWRENQFRGQVFDRIQSWNTSWLAWGGRNTIFTTWSSTTVEDGLGSSRNRIHAAASDSAWNVVCVGENGFVFLQNWTYYFRWDTRRVLTPVSVDLNSIAMWNSSELLAVGDSGVILHSTRPGYKWEILYRDPAGRSLNQVVTFPSGRAVAAGPEVLLGFTPGGSGWTEERRFPGGYLAAPALYGWYAVTPDGRVFFSEDNGRGWGERSTLPYHVRECHAFNAEDVYALCFDTSGGVRRSMVYRSTNYAATWEQVFQMVGDFTAMRLFDGSRLILIGEEGTVFVSDNFGRTWIKTRSRFRTKFNDIVPVQIHSGSNPEYLFIANQREMDLLLMRDPVLAQEEPTTLSESISLRDVYPNPATHVLHVRGAGEAQSQCRLSLHDLLGREVWTDRLDFPSAEGFRVSIDVARFARGMYILRLGTKSANESRLVHLR